MFPPTGPGSQEMPWEIITPSGRSAFLNPYKGTYSITSRSYAQRIRRGFERGITPSVARGHGVPDTGQYAGLSESQRRRQQNIESGEGELTAWQRVTFAFERRWGFSYNYWRKLQRNYVTEINSMIKSPYGKITPAWIAEELDNADLYRSMGYTAGEDWIEDRLAKKLQDMLEYRSLRGSDQLDQKGRSGPGSQGWMSWNTRDDFRPAEWWWYH